MAEKDKGQIRGIATEARQAAPGHSILLVLVISVVLVAAIFGILWLVFFHT